MPPVGELRWRAPRSPGAGLTVIQTATLVVSLPILLVGVLMSVALVKQLAKDHG